MAQVHQFYGELAPLEVPSSAPDVIAAWRSHRSRFRTWIEGLDEAAWQEPTRCSAWNVSELVQHLASGAQFLGYTLHQASKGEATRLLQSFDPQKTPGEAARMFAGLGRSELLAQLRAVDAQVEKELAQMPDSPPTAEAPPGHVAAHVSVNHFLYDSWVHERDLMLPLGQDPVVDSAEAAVVSSYVLGLACVARVAGAEPLESRRLLVTLSDLDRHLDVALSHGRARVSWVAAPGQANITGATADIVDTISGRISEVSPAADDAGNQMIRHFTTLMA